MNSQEQEAELQRRPMESLLLRALTAIPGRKHLSLLTLSFDSSLLEHAEFAKIGT